MNQSVGQGQPSPVADACCAEASTDVAQPPEIVPPRRILLSTWLAINYSAGDAPTPNTVRRWVREKRIQPAPEKQGRNYFFVPAARYVPPAPSSQ